MEKDIPTNWIVKTVPYLRELAALFESIYCSYELVQSAEDFLEKYLSHQYGCLIADPSAASIEHFALLNTLQQRALPIKIIFITTSESVRLAVEAMKSGSFDYFSSFDPQTILDSINLANREASMLHAKKQHCKRYRAHYEILTRRERDVLALMCEGCTSRNIAEQLEISLSTVEIHRNKVMKKIGVKSLAKLVSLAMQYSAFHSESELALI